MLIKSKTFRETSELRGERYYERDIIKLPIKREIKRKLSQIKNLFKIQMFFLLVFHVSKVYEEEERDERSKGIVIVERNDTMYTMLTL